ncbi:MAG: hypothetical protein K5644_07225 [Lachnospiraceae bacterium]|nr:hypothetical protein [Lachnospiraceae bacterium]
MNVLLSYLIAIILMLIIPFIFGALWVSEADAQKNWMYYGQSYAMGFFSMIAVFEIVCVPAAIMGLSFRGTMIVYSIILAIIFALLVPALKIRCRIHLNTTKLVQKLTAKEIVFLVLFLILLAVQLYYAIFYSRTSLAADGYVIYSTQALEDNAFFLTNTQTGLFQERNIRWIQRILQSYNFYGAYISLCCGIHPAVIAYTAGAVSLILMAYGVYLSISAMLFKNRDQQFLFILFVSLFYIYGWYSSFSIVFRLLGVNYEGKAILAVIMTPLMLIVAQQCIERGYDTKYGLQMLILSVASCSLSLAGVYTFIAVLVAAVVLGLIRHRNRIMLRYLWFGGAFPSLIAGIYVLCRLWL